jgi:hypothetical protein
MKSCFDMRKDRTHTIGNTMVQCWGEGGGSREFLCAYQEVRACAASIEMGEIDWGVD